MENKEIVFIAKPVSNGLPQHSMFYHVLVNNKIPLVLQLHPNGKWMTSGMILAEEVKNVTHYLVPSVDIM